MNLVINPSCPKHPIHPARPELVGNLDPCGNSRERSVPALRAELRQELAGQAIEGSFIRITIRVL